MNDLTIELLDSMPREQLIAIIEGPDESSRSRAAARMALIRGWGCSDCGAQAGRECKPDYGCVNAARSVPLDALAVNIQKAFDAVCEAEQIAYAGGMRSTIGAELVAAHSAILSAKNAYAAMGRDRVAAMRER